MSDALLYPERVNALNGESGSGKSWVALLTAAEVMAAGGHVIYVDLEDHPASIVPRLRSLGVTDDQMLNNLAYIRPEARFGPAAQRYIVELVLRNQTALVVIDSIGELMALEGCKPNDDDAVATLYRRIPRMLAKLGCAVLLIDHVPKDNERSPLYGIGSQRKRAAIDGAAYMVEQVKAFSADRPGLIKLVTAKDRNGNFATGTTAALIEVTPDSDGDHLKLDVRSPSAVTAGTGWRPTGLMEKASRYLEVQREANRNTIKEAIKANKSGYLKEALDALVEDGYLTRRQEGQAHIYVFVKPFRELADRSPNAAQGDDDATF